MALRTVVIYVFTLAIVRLGSRRLLSKPSAFDVIVAIMVGSIMSRAINGTAPFVPTMLAGIVLVKIDEDAGARLATEPELAPAL